MQFQNSQIGHKIWIKYFHVYEKIPKLDKNWTPIERKVVEIQIGNNPFHTIIEFNSQFN
jgi:hypothetical protein